MKQLITFLRTLNHIAYWLGLVALEWLYTAVRFPALLPALWRMWEWSVFRSPYRAAKRAELPQTEEPLNELTYGEITIFTIHSILRELQAGPNDLLLDLGSGRGRIVLLAAAQGIPAQGIELLPELVQLAQYAAADQFPLCQFQQGDLLTADLSQATFLWLTGTCWHESTRIQLAQRILKLPQHPIVISVSAPLPFLHIHTTLSGWSSWGKERFFIQQVQ